MPPHLVTTIKILIMAIPANEPWASSQGARDWVYIATQHTYCTCSVKDCSQFELELMLY